MIRFDLSIGLDYEVLSPTDFVFTIQPVNTAQQRVTWEKLCIEPHYDCDEDISGAVEGSPGNRHLRMRAAPGPLLVKYDAIVDVVHHFALPSDLNEVPIADLPTAVLKYIYPSRYCQSDRLMEVARNEFGTKEPGYARVEAIRQWVQTRTKFQVGSSHPGTSALDTYECANGVCRDFAHLMISICRALNIPARFATGIDFGADTALGPPDFHCYVEVYLGDRWYIFDPSGLSPRMALLRIGTGRDASDVSFATIFGTVRWSMPRVKISATTDQQEGLIEPFRCDYAVSTDPAFGELDESISLLHGPETAIKDNSLPSIAD